MRARFSSILCALLVASCADKSKTIASTDCEPGAIQCSGDVVQTCGETGQFAAGDNCATTGERCIPEFGCLLCVPETTFCCDEQNKSTYSCTPDLDVVACSEDGTEGATVQQCSTKAAEICVYGAQGAICEKACDAAAKARSYVGCEYYAVDMDNYAGVQGNAASQQYAIVLSNPSRLRAEVTIEINNALPGEPPDPQVVRTLVIDPENLAAIDDLPPREVDGSPEGTFDTGTDTALTSNAFRIRSTAPLIAYQFNPYQRGDVFSNDASLLVPTTATGKPSTPETEAEGSSYAVIGWPQLLADTDDPETDATVDLPALLTIVGTEADTTVTVQTAADIIGAPGVPETAAGATLEMILGPFDVLNLESDGFLQDFSGTQILSDKPVIVFSGNECTDVPDYSSRFTRNCCCDHMEEVLFPVQTFGSKFVAAQTPLRTVALSDAGSDVTPLPREPEYWRFLGTHEFTNCLTTLPAPLNELALQAGVPKQIEAFEDFVVECSGPVAAAQFVASQWKVVGPNNNTEPAGDPAFILVPPIEQYRDEYLFLVPEKYAFDFLIIAAPSGSLVLLDETDTDKFPGCERHYVGQVTLDTGPVDFDAIKCSLSEPEVFSGAIPPFNVQEGIQNDGIHRLQADQPVGLVVYGFDSFVSYGYPGGSNLEFINVQ